MQLRLYVYTRAHAVSVNDVTVLLFESLSLLFSFFLFFNWNIVSFVSIREMQVKFFRCIG